MSLFRTLFWASMLMLALALAPDFGVLGPASDRGRDKAGVEDLFYIVTETVSDLAGICGRRPRVCKKMDRIWEQFRNRAVYLTSAANEWLTGREIAGNSPINPDSTEPRRADPPSQETGRDDWRIAETPPEHRQ